MKIFAFFEFAQLVIFTRDFGEACVQQEFIDKVQVLESELSELEDAAELFGSDLSSTVDFLKKNYDRPKKIENEAQKIIKIDEPDKDLRHLPQLMIHVNEEFITPFLYRFLRRRRTGFEARSICASTNMSLALSSEKEIFSQKKRLANAFSWKAEDFESSTEKSCEMLFDDVHVDIFGENTNKYEGSGNFLELPKTCMENQFVCFYRLDAILIPQINGNPNALRLSDAYRFCESRKMTLFQPDTKAKNLFLSKLSILVDKPILFDLYRFGTNFEFKYGLYPSFTNWLPNEPKKTALRTNGKSKIKSLLRKDGLASRIVDTNRLGNGGL